MDLRDVKAALHQLRCIPGAGSKVVTWTTSSVTQGGHIEKKAGRFVMEGATGKLLLTNKAELARAWRGSQLVSLLVRQETGRTHAVTRQPTYVVRGYAVFAGRVEKLRAEATAECYNTDNATGAPLPVLPEIEFA